MPTFNAASELLVDDPAMVSMADCVVVPILTVDEPTKKILVPALTDVPLTMLNPLEVPRITSTSAALVNPYPIPRIIPTRKSAKIIPLFIIEIPFSFTLQQFITTSFGNAL